MQISSRINNKKLMKFKKIIIDYKYYLMLSYVLIIYGIILSHNYHPDKIKITLYYLIIGLTFTTPTLSLILNYLFQKDKTIENYYFKINIFSLNIYSKVVTKSFIQNYIKFAKSVGLISLILIPVFTGIYCFNSLSSNASNTYPSLITISIIMSLFYTNTVRTHFYKEDSVTYTYTLFGALTLNLILTNEYASYLLNKLMEYVLSNLQDSLTILIAIIMLCVGLSALSFAYCSILPKNNTRKKMRKNGEGYFIASILSMIAISLLFLTSILKDHIIFTPLISLNIMSINFILINFYSLGLILILSCTLYTTYLMIICSISSLRELKLF